MKNENENKQKMECPSERHPMTMDEFLGISGTTTQPTKPTQPTQPTQPTKPRKSRVGKLNPFYDHHHSAESKAKMSNTQRARYEMMRQNMTNEGRRAHLREIIREEVERLIKTQQN